MKENDLAGPLRETIGTVIKYSERNGYGFIAPICDKWNDCFVSYRDVEPDEKGIKRLHSGEYVEFKVYQNSDGFVAKDVKRLTAEEFKDMVHNR